MFEQLSELNPITLALIATGFTWIMTAIGASSVFFVKRLSRKVIHLMLGFAGGEMLAAAFFSLLNHSVEMVNELGDMTIIDVAIGFLLGGLFVWSLEHIMPMIHRRLRKNHKEFIPANVRAQMVVADIFVYYLPEGLALGVAFGALFHHFEFITLASGIGLMVGLGTQNVIEASAVTVPLKRLGMTKKQSFLYGVLSGIVQPIAGLIGALLVMLDHHILPSAFAFAAGALIYGVVEELLPEAFKDDHKIISTGALMVGFTAMMVIKVFIK